jgi:AcrR family transcriptional regulator
MVQVIFKGQDRIRMDQIIDAACKRFALFGFEKTTMKEIAGDLNMSKGSLYYYFPDKENLYKAIVFKEHDQFIQTIQREVEQAIEPAAMLRKVVLIRQELFRTLINLGRTRTDALPEIHLFMKETVASLRSQEREIIRDILSKGVSEGIFNVNDKEEMADLFLDMLKGLRMTMLGGISSSYNVNEEYEVLLRKTNLLVDIFIKGISV